MENDKYELNWGNYSWREFEVICFEFIKEIYSAEFYEIRITPKRKDQGRDIIVKSHTDDFEAWGECKDHTRNIDLSVIGKNIVLALSHQINKVIFFSVSTITINTKIEILNVAQRFGFEVLFLDGNELNITILSCKKVALKYFRNEYERYFEQNSGKILVSNILSEYPYAEDAKNNVKVQYHLRNGFQIFLHIFIKNMHNECLYNINICLSDYDTTKLTFYKTNYVTNGMLTSYADLLVTFPGLVFSPNKNIVLPHIRIEYTLLDGKKEEIISEGGEIDASDVWKAPYIDSNSASFYKQATHTLKCVVPQKYIRILFIYGKSGMGKSRLMTEIENYAYELCYRVINVDFRSKSEKECMRDFTKGLLGLPSSKSKIKIEFKEFSEIFIDKHMDLSTVNMIYKFLYEDDNKISYMNLTSALIDALVIATTNGSIVIGIDNIQEITKELQLLFWNILEHCREVSIPVCFLFVQNTERLPEVNNALIEYLKISGENYENYVMPQHCTLLSDADAVLLMQELLHLVPDSKNCLHMLFHEIETCPMDILLLSKSLVQTPGLFRKADSYRYIMEPKDFIKTATSISKTADALVKNRLDNLIDDPSRITKYHELFSLINFFDGILPAEIFYACKFESDLLVKPNQNLIIKINYTDNMICFYHEKVHKFFQQNAVVLPMYILNTIYNFYSNNPDENIVSAYIFVKVLIARKEYETAITTGIEVIEKYKETHQSQNLCKTCDLLQQIINVNKHPREYFYVIFAKADILLERVDISAAEDLFEEARGIAETWYKFLDQKDIIHFNHKYINQKLHTLQYSKGLAALEKFEKSGYLNFKADMIINDRYCVAYYSIGREKEALERINYVIQEAEKAKDYTWLSIGYSDKAFVYFYNSKNITKICDNFMKAAEYYRHSGETDDISRKIEILIQESLSYLLKNEDELALEFIQESIRIAEEIIYGYLLVPAFNIYAYIMLKKRDVDSAHMLLKKALSYGNSYFNKKALISVYNNLGNMYMIKREYQQAIEYYQTGLDILKRICTPENSFRYLGLLCNIIKTSTILNDEQHTLPILKDYHMFDSLKRYHDQCRVRENVDLFSFSHGVLGLEGYDYLY